MADPNPRNPSAAEPTRIDGAATPHAHRATEQTVDAKFRLVERLDTNASVTISRERVFDSNSELTHHLGNLLVITTTGRDDTILIDQRKDGTLDIKVNDKQYLVSLAATQDLAIRSQGGNDRIIANPRVTANMLVEGGSGDDVIATGDGDDHVQGGDGNDVVLTRGGKDYFFGSGGNDTADLGAGADIGYGGEGNDSLQGGNGDDYLDGGRGTDSLRDHSGWNTLCSGEGNHPLDGGTGRTYASKGIDPLLGSSIGIVGTQEFRERVKSDLDTLRSSPVGQQMLAALDLAAKNKGNSVTITELANEKNGFALPTGNGDPFLKSGRYGVTPGSGMDTSIGLNPSYGGTSGRPIIVLFHELSHAYNFVTGTLQPGIYAGPGIDQTLTVNKQPQGIDNFERQAVGLSNTGLAFDFDGKPGTAPTEDNPVAQTENGLRAEMGLALRQSYRRAQAPSTSAGTRSDPDLDPMMKAMLAGDSVAFERALTEFGESPYAQQARKQATSTPDAQEPKLTVEQTNARSRSR
jgi:hypothetical protein